VTHRSGASRFANRLWQHATAAVARAAIPTSGRWQRTCFRDPDMVVVAFVSDAPPWELP
jgi:hypothetical protein